MSFDALTEQQLSRLPPEELLAHIDSARDTGHQEAMKTATGILAWRYERSIAGRVALKIPKADCEDVVLEIMIGVIEAVFDGRTIGEFRSFMNTITTRRIADYHRKPKRKQVPLGVAEEDEGEHFEPEEPDFAALIDNMDVVQRVLADRSDLHAKVIRLYGPAVAGFGQLTAEETKAAIDADETDDTVSLNNVAKIWSRFRADVESELGG